MMESKLMQVVQHDGISAEHGYSKNVELHAENSNPSAEMSQAGTNPDQQGQQPQQSLLRTVNVTRGEPSSPAKQSHATQSPKAGRAHSTGYDPDQYAKQLLAQAQSRQKVTSKSREFMPIPRLQQQLQNSANSSPQSNVVSSSVAPNVADQSKDQLVRKSRRAILLSRPAAGIRQQLQHGLLQQNVAFNSNQPQVIQTVHSVQAVIPHPQRQASPNVRLVSAAPSTNAQITPRAVNIPVRPIGTGPRPLTPIAPKQAMGKQTIPANFTQSNVAIPMPINSQLQPNSETLIIVSQAGSGDPGQVVTAPMIPGAHGNQVVYTMAMKNPQPIPKQNFKSKTILMKSSKQAGVIAQQRQIVTTPIQAIKQQVCAVPNGVNIKGNVQRVQPSAEEGQEREEEEEEEERPPKEDPQNCPTLAEEQRLQYNLIPDNVKGGGGKKIVEPKSLKGNATGLHMVRQQESTPTAVTGRNWQYSSEGKDLKRPPLRPDSTSGQPAAQGADNADSQTEAARRKPTEPNQFAVCNFCGHISKNYTQCDYCHRTLPADFKFYCPKGGEPESVKVPPGVQQKKGEETKAAIETEQFYTKTTPRILAKRGKTGKAAKRKKTEPEMVTISSDEEEEEDDESCADSPAPAQTVVVAGKQIVLMPQTSNQAPVIQQQVLHMPLNNSQMANTLTRRQRMEDPQGNVVKKRGRKKKKLTPAEEAKVLEQLVGGDDEEDMLPDTVALDTRGIRIGSLRGSAYAPVVFADTGITLSIECTELSVGELVISVHDVTRVLYHLGVKMPCIFLQTTPECTNRIRLKCSMVNRNSNPYYDPTSPDESQREICIILDKLNQEEKVKLKCMFEHYDAVTHVRHNLVETIDYNMANVLLAKSSGTKNQISVPSFMQPTSDAASPLKYFTVNTIPGFHGAITLLPNANFAEGQHSDMDADEDDEPQDRSRSPSPPLSVFAGPIVKLYTYPPPPATGGITVTNEDLFCLNEGEFLNDVIIDFYLKYLYLNELEEHEREKTHIFSSFFYRRLTQKARRVTEEGETPQQKRHNRVKTWTRHVDLFKKDFIIVPINESAHWYLAIICFPWMTKPERLNVITHEVGPLLGAEGSEQQAEADKLETPAADESQKSETVEMAENNGKTEEEKVTEDSDESKMETDEKNSEGEGKESVSQSNKTNGAVEAENGQEGAGAEDGAAKEKSAESEEKKESSEECEKMDSQPTAGSSMKTVLRQACILVFDSLAGPSRSSVVRTLREYLQVEWDVKKGKTEGPRSFDKDLIKGANPKCPQQTNYSDCGVYLLQYVESFFEDPVQDYVIPMKALGNWFPEERVRCKREELRELLLTLKKELNPNLEYDCSKDIVS